MATLILDTTSQESDFNPLGADKGYFSLLGVIFEEASEYLFGTQFASHYSVLFFFSLSLELMITQQTTQFKLCTKDYITTMYPA